MQICFPFILNFLVILLREDKQKGFGSAKYKPEQQTLGKHVDLYDLLLFLTQQTNIPSTCWNRRNFLQLNSVEIYISEFCRTDLPRSLYWALS